MDRIEIKEEDFEIVNENGNVDNLLDEDKIQQILKDYEIVNRLKERIKFWNALGEFPCDYPDWYKFVEEFQKILGEK